MSTKIALFGNVNTEEILARKLKEERDSHVTGYLLFPNQAFADACDSAVAMSPEFIQNELIDDLRAKRHDVLHVGPIIAAHAVSDILKSAGLPFVGPAKSQLEFELDKTFIQKVFARQPSILPRRFTLRRYDEAEIHSIVAELGGRYVAKFVKGYSERYTGSEVGRVRFGDETITEDELLIFMKNSIEVGGAGVIEELVRGCEFSANYLVDGNGTLCRLGENVCFKRRNNGDTGPICDGTGSISIDNTLPFLTQTDIQFIENRIVSPFHEHVKRATGEPLIGMLNLDLMKREDGSIVLFEINCREAGGHTMANILSGIKTPLSELLLHAQRNQLDRIKARFSQGTSIVVSAFPGYFPAGTDDDSLEILDVPRDMPSDVRLYTGWVDTIAQSKRSRKLRLRNSPSLLFEHRNTTVKAARKRIYAVIDHVVAGRLDFRTDIGQMFASDQGGTDNEQP